MEQILIVEDDRMLNEGIAYALEREGYTVCSAFRLKEAMICLNRPISLIILDINLPDGDGREFLWSIRPDNSIPVIFLTAKDTEEDIMAGFDAGGDDYIVKPFSIPVLLKRVKAVIKRTGKRIGQIDYCGNLTYDYKQKTLKREGEPIDLTATELRLLELFLANRNNILTREVILQRIWDAHGNFVNENTLNVHIARLREKIEEDPKQPQYIRTAFGIGYKWSDEHDV